MKKGGAKRRQTVPGRRDTRRRDLWRLEVPLEVSEQSSVACWKQERWEGLKMRNGSLQGKCGCLKESGLERKTWEIVPQRNPEMVRIAKRAALTQNQRRDLGHYGKVSITPGFLTKGRSQVETANHQVNVLITRMNHMTLKNKTFKWYLLENFRFQWFIPGMWGSN